MVKIRMNELKKAPVYITLIFISALLLFPIIYMLTNSFMSKGEVLEQYGVLSKSVDVSSPEQIERFSFHFIPDRVTLMQYYQVLLRKPKFLLMFWNSMVITLPIMAGQMLVAAMAAYAFSKLRFPLRGPLIFLYILVMLLPFQVTLVPNYIIFKQMKLMGTYWAVILPGVFSSFGVFLLRQFMMLIPDEYCEAAKIDGAGYIRTFTRIILPQCKGAIASLAILVFIDNWNMVEQPLIFLKNEAMYPLSIFLSSINNSDLGLAFACGFLYMIPVLLVFLYGENYLIEGIQLSGIK